jgi:hypothetical protein
MYQGTVKFFSPRGFGFLKRDDGLDEIYFHKTGIPGGVTLFRGRPGGVRHGDQQPVGENSSCESSLSLITNMPRGLAQ